MTTLKRNLQNRPLTKKSDYQQMTQFTFEKVLSNTQKNNFAQDHRSLIDEIRSKNILLTKVDNQKKFVPPKTLPTNCEKYVNILYKKYGLKAEMKPEQPKCKQIPATFLSKEQQLNRSIFLAKQFLQNAQQDFEYSIGQLLLRLKQISNNLSSKNRNLKENDKSREDELVILEFFSNKLTNKITKTQLNPYFFFTQQIKSQAQDNKNYQQHDQENLNMSTYHLPLQETEKSNDNMLTDKLDNYFNEEDQFINSVTQEFISNLKMSTQNQFKTTGNLMSIYSQSVDQFSKIIQSTHLTISEEQLLIEGEWNEISLFLNKDIQEMFDLLELERTENQMKDKKFLENLDTIQNQLIEEIFAQKESRKADQQLLTQVLANLAESIQREL